MATEPLVLTGKHVRLEPLEHRHVDALVAAAAALPSLYRWSPVPQGKVEAIGYVNTALTWRDAGTAAPSAIVRVDNGVVIGSTRFWNLEQWSWPRDRLSLLQEREQCILLLLTGSIGRYDMRTKWVPVVLSICFLAGCAAAPLQTTRDEDRCDYQRMAQLERIAAQERAQLVWVNCPLRTASVR